MRLILLATAAAALSACSSYDMFGSNFGHQSVHHIGASHHQANGSYGAPQSNRYASNHSYQTQVHNGYAYAGQAPSQAGPVHIYPTGHNVPAYAHHGAGAPALRGPSRPQFYGNLGAIAYESNDLARVDGDPYGIIGRLGVQSGYVGAEVEASTSVANKDIVDVDYSVAAFGVVRAPIGRKVNVLGRVGYGKANVNDVLHLDGVAYGAGAEYNFDALNGVRIDYTRYHIEDGDTADGVSATFLRRF